jgi:hypothetical protein
MASLHHSFQNNFCTAAAIDCPISSQTYKQNPFAPITKGTCANSLAASALWGSRMCDGLGPLLALFSISELTFQVWQWTVLDVEARAPTGLEIITA